MPISLPSDLVRLRPDILAAEAQLQSASAEIGVATAELYQSFTLNGDHGQNSTSPLRLIQANYQAGVVNYLQGLIADSQSYQAKIGYLAHGCGAKNRKLKAQLPATSVI